MRTELGGDDYLLCVRGNVGGEYIFVVLTVPSQRLLLSSKEKINYMVKEPGK